MSNDKRSALTKRNYYWIVLRQAVTGAYSRVEGAGLLIAGIAWLAMWEIPALKEAINDNIVPVTIVILALVTVVRLVLAPYWLARDAESDRQHLIDELHRVAGLQQDRDTIAVALDEIGRAAFEGETLAQRIIEGTATRDDCAQWVHSTQTLVLKHLGASAAAEMASAGFVAQEQGQRSGLGDAQVEADSLRALVSCLHRYAQEIRAGGLPPTLPDTPA